MPANAGSRPDAKAAVFRFKTFLLQIKLSVEDYPELRRFERADTLIGKFVIGESRTRLWTESGVEDRILIAGKIHNLRLAVRKLNGIEIDGGAVFSF